MREPLERDSKPGVPLEWDRVFAAVNDTHQLKASMLHKILKICAAALALGLILVLFSDGLLSGIYEFIKAFGREAWEHVLPHR